MPTSELGLMNYAEEVEKNGDMGDAQLVDHSMNSLSDQTRSSSKSSAY